MNGIGKEKEREERISIKKGNSSDSPLDS